MDLSKILKDLRSKYNLNQEDLAKIVNKSQSSIGRYENGTSEIPAQVLIDMCNYFNISLDSLLGITSNPFMGKYDTIIKKYSLLSDENKLKIDSFLEIATINTSTYITPFGYETTSLIAEPTSYYGYKSIPVRGYVAAGVPIEAINNPLGEIQIASSIDADYALIVSGNSMNPVILDGSYVLVKNISELNNGDIGVFYYDNNVTCKKWFKNDKIIKLISINPAYTDYVFDISDTKNENLDFKIEGKVVSTDYKFN